MKSTIKRVLGAAAIATTVFTGVASTASATTGPTGGGGILWHKYLSYDDCWNAGVTMTQYPYHWTSFACPEDNSDPSHGTTYDLWLA
ncbi:MAG: hypothetical protein HOW97_33940 [Catenulispora sp.]|nr:hypothetical protein [Catenulispora sp.]